MLLAYQGFEQGVATFYDLPGISRPYVLVASILFIAFGFYQAWRAKKCQRRTSVISSILLWASAAFVFVSIFFPQIMANVIAGFGAR